MFKRHVRFLPAAAIALMAIAGCGRSIDGPRFWWDDRRQERLSDEYSLPPDPAAEDEYGTEKRAAPSGEDLSENDLLDYRTNLDQQEEKRKSDASLVDF